MNSNSFKQLALDAIKKAGYSDPVVFWEYLYNNVLNKTVTLENFTYTTEQSPPRTFVLFAKYVNQNDESYIKIDYGYYE